MVSSKKSQSIAQTLAVEQKQNVLCARMAQIVILQLTLALAATGLFARQASQSAKTSAAKSNALSGEQLYKRHCAVCHGNDLKGNGPAPEPFRQQTPDLTTLAVRYKGFPDAYISNVLRNGVKIVAHGPAEMPIWGATFREAEELNQAQIDQRIASLIDYIKAHQQKPAQ